MGEGIEPLVGHANTEDVLDCEYVKHSVKEHVIWQVVETTARAKPGFAKGGRPGEAEGWGEDHCQQ